MELILYHPYGTHSSKSIDMLCTFLIDKPLTNSEGVVEGFVTSAIRDDENNRIIIVGDVHPDQLTIREQN